MTEKLKEAEVLRNIIDRIGNESDLLHADELNLLEKVREVYRTVLEAGEKIEFHAAPNNYTTIEKQYAECEHQAQDWLASDCIHCKFAVLIARARHLEETIQAVLPVVAKKDLIIAELQTINALNRDSIEKGRKENAEQAKRIEELERKVKDYQKYKSNINQALNEGDGVYRP